MKSCKKRCPLNYKGKCLSGDPTMITNPTSDKCKKVQEYFKRLKK